MKLTMLGTGNALVTKYYNTCFVLEEQERYFLIDGGGGNTLFRRLEETKIPWDKIRDIFVTHKHLDHIMGIIWMVRMICQHMREGDYQGEARIYAHEELLLMLREICGMLIQKKDLAYLDTRLFLVPVEDGEEKEILGHKVQFFDIHSTKAKQFGFTMEYEEGKKLTCLGDEPFHKEEEEYVKGSTWLLEEAFCLLEEAEHFHPYEKHHATVKEACELGEKYHIPHVLLYHTEDATGKARKDRYQKEGKQYYQGSLFVPEDKESILL